MGLPPVVVGLIVYLLLSRAGPLGSLGWLFTPQAMIVAQVMLATPLIIGLTLSAILSVEPDLASQLRSLGATQTQISRAILREARAGIIVAIATAFGRIASEVGAIMLVGGNVAGETRTLTTAIVLETRQGQFDQAIALGLVLLMIAFTINLILIVAQPKRLWMQT
jgi:tungstate transport system permease protein